MRIVHIIGSLDPAVGGPPRVAACLAAAQAALGHDVRILTTVNPDRQRQVDEMTQLMPGWSKVEVLHSPGPSLVQSLAAWPVPPVMHEAMRWAQVAHLHSFWGSSLRLAVKAARRQRTPYLLTPHGTLDPWSLAQKKLKKRIAMAMGFRKLLDHAAMVHALNEDERRLIDPLKLKCPIMVIPNGVFLEEIDPLPSAEGFASGRPGLKGKNYMLFLSRLHYKKGLDVLADAYSKFVRQGGGLDLVVAGPDAGARADFEQRVRHHGVTDGVHIVGPLYGQDKIAAMSGATVFVLPTRQEGFSVVIIEALACELPVITTHDAHFPELNEAGAGFTVSVDVEEVAVAMKQIDGDRAAAKNMGRAGRQLVVQRYTWPRIAEQMVRVYEQVAGETGR